MKQDSATIDRRAFIGSALAATAAAAIPLRAQAQQPGAGALVKPLRATWDTFWFGGVILQIGLQRLGYRIAEPQALAPAAMYKALAQGDGHFSADVVMPNAAALTDPLKNDLVIIGPIMKPGSVTGYLIDKATAEKHDIRYITDLLDPAKAKLFGDGAAKARLLGPGVGWNDERVALQQLDRLGLKATIDMEQGEYNVLVADAVTRYRAGKPVLIYGWYPNTATVQLRPGIDLVWLQMKPEHTRPELAFTGIPGCAGGGETCNTGWSPTTYYIGANAAWARANPAAAKFLSLVKMDLQDRVDQNIKMVNGEKREADLLRHANEWIGRNTQRFDAWIAEAAAAKV